MIIYTCHIPCSILDIFRHLTSEFTPAITGRWFYRLLHIRLIRLINIGINVINSIPRIHRDRRWPGLICSHAIASLIDSLIGVLTLTSVSLPRPGLPRLSFVIRSLFVASNRDRSFSHYTLGRLFWFDLV